jgi:hypothetical protein
VEPRKKDETEELYNKRLLEWQNRYRNLFGTRLGEIVLVDLLQELNFFDMIVSEEDRVKHNIAKRILFLCGGWSCKLIKNVDK